MKEKQAILSPCDGEVISLGDVTDEVFSSGVMGEGFGTLPSSKKIFAPVSGKIENAYKTGHAYTIIAEDGLEVLVHIGIDTVMLGGECFDAKVEVGDYIKKGELICVADIDKILEKGFDPVVVVVVTNAEKMHSQEVKYGKAYAGDEVLLYEIK